jgi:uncharacterized phage infection (PIP) family protein YhgE
MDSAQDEVANAADALRATVAELRVDVRSTLDDVGGEIERLDQRYMSAGDDVAATWLDARAGMRQYSDGIEADLAQLEMAGEEEAEGLKREISADLEQLTQRVERAQLESFETGAEFLSASQARMVDLGEELRDFEGEAASLTEDARADASESLEDFGDRRRDLERQLDGLTNATAEEIDEQRDDIAQALSTLAASVRRELFEIRQAVTD